MENAVEEEKIAKKETYRKKTKKSKAQIMLQDKAGHNWFCDDTKEDFRIYPPTRPIDVYNDLGEKKRFIKKFLKVDSYLI